MTPDPRAAAWFDTVSIMPISPGSKIPYKGFEWTGLQKAPAPPEVRAAWRKDYPGCNWALITGAVSGIVALDWDKSKGRELRKEKNVYGGPASITPRGGFHTLHRHPGREIQNKARLLGDENGGLDIRGDGGYIVIPPSIFEGKSYKWEIPPWMIDAPPLPEWALELIGKKLSTASPTIAAPEGIGEADGLPAGVGEGQRNDTAARLAGRYIAKGLSAEETYSILYRWNRKNRPAMADEELRELIFRIARKEREKAPLLELVDAGELVSRPAENAVPLVAPFFPRGGCGFLAGDSGIGKTLLAYNLGYSVANELPFLGRLPVTQGNVLYIDCESTQDLARNRVARIARGMHTTHRGVSFVFPKASMDLNKPKDREVICGLIDKKQAALLFLDSFLCFSALRSENDNSEVRAFLEKVKDISRATGCATVFLDHTAKANAEQKKAGIRKTVRGAIAKENWADFVLIFEERKDNTRFLRTLTWTKTRGSRPIPSMILEMDGNFIFSPTGEEESVPLYIVSQIVADHPGIRQTALETEISVQTGVVRNTARKAIDTAKLLLHISARKVSKYVEYYPGKSLEKNDENFIQPGLGHIDENADEPAENLQ